MPKRIAKKARPSAAKQAGLQAATKAPKPPRARVPRSAHAAPAHAAATPPPPALAAGAPAGPPWFGSHLSIAGSMVHALHEAQSLGLSTVQVFTKNQQQWKPTPLDEGVAREWCDTLRAWGWDAGGPTGRGRVVSHASYLINLASPNDELWEKSIALMRVEIERCEKLNIAFLVHHPGAFTTSTREEGLGRIARAYARLHKDLPGFRTCMCLEGTAGSGSNLGGPFEDLRELRSQILALGVPGHLVGFCLDTCHLHAAGHDMSSVQAARASLARFDELCGLQHVRVWHLNDSKGGLGSHLDRHDHIGMGCVGGRGAMPPAKGSPAIVQTPTAQALATSGFAAVLARFASLPVPMILETPKEDAKEARGMATTDRADWTNLQRLRGILDASGPAGAAERGADANNRRPPKD